MARNSQVVNTATAEADGSDRARSICAACTHPWDAHDQIGRRFCTATIAGSYHRGCVCVGDTINRA